MTKYSFFIEKENLQLDPPEKYYSLHPDTYGQSSSDYHSFKIEHPECLGDEIFYRVGSTELR